MASFDLGHLPLEVVKEVDWTGLGPPQTGTPLAVTGITVSSQWVSARTET